MSSKEQLIRRRLLNRYQYAETGILNLIHETPNSSSEAEERRQGILAGLAMARKYLDEVIPEQEA